MDKRMDKIVQIHRN